MNDGDAQTADQVGGILFPGVAFHSSLWLLRSTVALDAALASRYMQALSVDPEGQEEMTRRPQPVGSTGHRQFRPGGSVASFATARRRCCGRYLKTTKGT